MNAPKTNPAVTHVPPAPASDLSVAYIKACVMEGAPGYAIHAANGQMIGWCEDRAVAFAAAGQLELTAFSVH